MKQVSPPPVDTEKEIAALVESLHQTGQRLEELTGGEVDSVVDRSGRMFLMRGVREQMRQVEAAQQTAILSALPAHIALLDSRGTIVSVNAAWRHFADANDLHSPGHAIGVNYLKVCDAARGPHAFEAKAVARGIRAVLDGSLPGYSMEYPCHAPAQQRWFLMTATPMAAGQPGGAVVMHLNITDQRAAQARVRESEARFRSLSELSSDWFWEQDENHRFVRFSGGSSVQGWGPDQDKAVGLHRWDLGGVLPISSSWEEHKALLDSHKPFRNFEYQRVLGDGRLQYVAASGEPRFGEDGRFTGYRGVATEITVRKEAEARIFRLNRVYAVLSGINSAIVRIRDRGELFDEVCRVAVSAGGFDLVRIVELDAAGKASVAASSEPTTPLFQRIIDEYNADPAHSQTLLALALRGRKAMISNDVAADPRMPNRLALTQERNFAIAVLPVYVGLRLAGALLLRSHAAGAFTEDEIRLLLEMTGDISFALDNIEKEAKLGILAAAQVRDQAVLQRFSAAMNATADALYLVDRASMRFIHVNDAACRMRGETREELMARAPEDILSVSRAELEKSYDALIASGTAAEPMVLLRPRPNGEQSWVELRRHAKRTGDGWTIVTLVRDITASRQADAKIISLNRVNAMLGGINALIVRVKDRDELFREACRIAVDAGGFRMSWVGLLDADAGRIALSASAGADAQLLDSIQALFLSPEGAADGNTLSARAIRTRLAVVSNDSKADPAVLFGLKNAAFGIRSMAMLPLIVADRAVGVFVLYAREIDFFHDEELGLLQELAANIAFAIDHIDKEAARRAAEARVVRLNRVYAVLSGINSLIVRVRDREELFKEACRIAVEHGNFIMAWIGIVDPEAMKLVPLASAGSTQDHMTLINQRFELGVDAPRGNVLSARAIREGKIAISNDVRNDPEVLFKDEHAARGSRSMAMLPLRIGGEVIGILALYSSEAGFFDAEETKLLEELAGDIAFAVDHIAKRDRLDYLAYYDALTGLANRGLFLERVAQHMRAAVDGGHKLALFFIDLERFKNINDSLGRSAGDALLKKVAEWLTANIGDVSLLARLGADNFALVLPEIRKDGDIGHLVEKSIAAFMEHSFQLNDSAFRIAVKAGVALFPADGTDADTLLRNAEAALKKAKASGERYLFYTQKMTDAQAGKLTLENQLRQALEREEFVLHYQPKVNLATGKLAGAEALIRWNDPRTGLVPPGRFIPMLEETGLIYDVGRWALRKALEDYLRWRAAGLPAVRIAVNVSPLQLRNRGFVAEIAQKVGIDPHAAAGLELEITESVIMDDVKRNIATLREIRGMGVTIAIDDFGTGFSSLSYLSKLPVDTLKIDRSFVVEMMLGPGGLSLVATIINLAHSMKLKVVAEGVETEEQSRLLRLLGCDEMQGFLFSKPVPAGDFESRFLAAQPVPASP